MKGRADFRGKGLLLGCLAALLWASVAGGAEDTETHPLVGEPAPAFDLELLAGGRAALADHHGKDLVVLDFWATWCGPCTAALPLVAQVAETYQGKGVAVYAVDLREEPGMVRGFLEKQKLKLNVVLDPDGKVGGLYRVSGIPQTVIIDRDGTVAAVHIGFNPEMKADLGRELDLLLAGKRLAKSAPEPTLENLELAWQYPGIWSGLAADGSELCALSPAGRVAVLGPSGERLREFQWAGADGLLRPARLATQGPRGLLAFKSWGPQLLAVDGEGKELWRYPGGQGIDDVWAADLDGDGIDEIIIGYNGSTGLHVLGSDGRLRWKSAAIGNVWHVCAGDILGQGHTDVITTSAQGLIHRFAAGGVPREPMDPGIYAHMLRLGPGSPAPIYTAGTRTEDDREVIARYDAAGQQQWVLVIGDSKAHVDSMQITSAPGGSWMAAALRGGHLLVVDALTGKVLGSAHGEPTRVEVAWVAAAQGAPPLLVVTGRSGLRAYRVKTP